MDKHIEAFMMYVTFLLTMAIYLAKKTQIVLLVAKKLKILIKYLDFSDIFLEKKALILPETTELNQYAIKQHKGQ